ncbi:hypothetical protein EPO04_03270 [Patescibacteria group bacterium]|nr:MAG: hypothetical protein EPO04_03270 [Patescibacteria group bacterium]
MPVEERDRQIAGGASDDAAAAKRAAKAEEARELGLYIPEDFVDNPQNPGSNTGIAKPDSTEENLKGSDDSQMRRVGRMRGLADRAVTQFRGLSGNRRVVAAVLGGGGIVGIMIALFLTFAQFKLIHMMENMADHLFSRNQHMFEVRRDVYMREFYNNYLGAPDSNIDDSTATLSQQIMRRMKDGLEPRLNEKYKVEVKADPASPRYKRVKFTDKRTGQVTEFSTAFTNSEDRRRAREFNKQVSREITRDDGWLKRVWFKGRMTRITGTKWNWLDPIKQPYNKAKLAASNQVAKFLLSDQSKASGLRKQLISKLFGDTDIEDSVNSEISTAASADDAQKLLSEKITSAASKGVSTVGLAVLAVQVGCSIDDLLSKDTFNKAVRQKMEIEYMTQYASMISKSSQLKLGKTDGNTVNAHMAMMTFTDKNGRPHDVAESNNYRRATGEKVDYHPTDNCNDYSELCEAKLPGKATSDHAIAGNFLAGAGAASSAYNSTAYQVAAKVIPLPGIPGSFGTDAVCYAWDHGIKQISNGVADVVDRLLSAVPVVRTVWGEIKGASADVVGAINDKFMGWIAVSVVDADTTGPFLASATGAGGSLAAASAAGSPVGTDATGDDSQACHNKSAEEKAQDDSFCGKPLSRDQIAQTDRVIAQEEYEDAKNAPFMTKIASLDTPYSLASKVVDAIPASPQTLTDRTSQFIIAATNPHSLMKALRNLPNALSPQAIASQGQGSLVVNSDGTDQYNTRIYGHTEEDLQKPLDSPGLENLDRNTGCSIIAGLKGKKDKHGDPIELPEKCEIDGQSGNYSVNSPDTPDNPGDVTGDAKTIAQHILDEADKDNPKIIFNPTMYNSQDEADGSTPRKNVEQIAHGQKAKTTTTCGGSRGGAVPPVSEVVLNTSLLKFILELSGRTTIHINALAGQCHHDTSSNHYKGKAIDFGCPLNASEADAVGRKYGISDGTGEYCSNTSHYHYSVGGH